MSLNFFALICFLTNLLTAYFLGRLVVAGRVPVFISRKILHITFYLMPFVIVRTVDLSLLRYFGLSLAFFAMLKLALYTKIVRERVSFLNYCFAALDRPEDRPYTLRLLFIQKASHALIINLGKFLSPDFMKPAIFFSVAYLTLTFGDGLAEPVGRLVKSYRYKVFSIYQTRENYRTVAGSLCVYFAALLLVYFYYPESKPEFIYQLMFIPVLATLFEAWSPRAMDAPFLFFGVFFSMHFIANVF